MNKKKWMSILLCLMLVFTCVSPVFAGTGSAWTVDDFTYDTAGTTITGLSTTGQEKIKTNPDLVLPEKGPGGEAIVALGDGVSYPVAGIFDYSVDTKNYTPASVVLPASLKKIGKWTFAIDLSKTYEAQMTSITFPDGLEEIGQAAFQNAKLTSVSIPDSVTTMGQGAFTGNGDLKTIKLSKNCKDIPQAAFSSGMSSTLSIKELIIPEGVETIGRQAFDTAKVEKVVFPSTLTTIGRDAFKNHQMTSVVIPSSVTKIDRSAFSVANTALPKKLTSVTLNEGLVEIGQEAFANNGMTEIYVPSTVTKLGKNVFKGMGEVKLYVLSDAQKTTLEAFKTASSNANITFVVNIESLEDKTSLAPAEATYTGSAVEPEVAIEGLTEGTDFTVEYKDNINSGFAKAVVSGKGNYYGSFELQFAIKAKDVNDVKDKATLEFTEVEYTGGEFQPAVSIEGLTYGQDYSVAWGDNVNPGTAKAVVTGIGNYEGTFELEFEIKAPATDDNEGGNGGNGDADLGGDDYSDKEENDDADKEDDKEIPETGDNAPLALMMALMLAAAAGGYTAYRRNYTK